MDVLELIKGISFPTSTKIVLLAIDGLGGLPHPDTGKTELETARTPNLDSMANKGNCGLMDPVIPGISPGSVPGHLAILGFDPLIHNIGRGAMEAMGINFDLQADDVVARGNFAVVDKKGIIIDRRAGRMPLSQTTELCKLLDRMEIDGVKIFVHPLGDYRFIVVFRGEGLASGVTDSDPQINGTVPKKILPLTMQAERTASVANKFIARANALLSKNHQANAILLRGFSKRPQLPSLSDVYKIKAAAISNFPLYRGLARLVGMDLLDAGNTLGDLFSTLQNHFEEYDFISLHVKHIDTAGEDKNFNQKVELIEQLDRHIETMIKLKPDVTVVTSDHSTPAIMGLHSWHPVPVIISSPWCRPDGITKFSEYNCLKGSLGRFPATHLMPLAMAYAQKLGKFGA